MFSIHVKSVHIMINTAIGHQYYHQIHYSIDYASTQRSAQDGRHGGQLLHGEPLARVHAHQPFHRGRLSRNYRRGRRRGAAPTEREERLELGVVNRHGRVWARDELRGRGLASQLLDLEVGYWSGGADSSGPSSAQPPANHRNHWHRLFIQDGSSFLQAYGVR